MPYKDPEKQKEYKRKWYEEHRESEIKKAYINKQARIITMQKFANDYKAERGCCRCPENDPVCLDFHHPNKEMRKG